MSTIAPAQTPIERILELLPNVKGPNTHGFYQAHCPAHNDGKCSLSFKAVGNGVYFDCFAFCERSAILAALNLTEDDLRTGGKQTQKGPSITLLDLAQDKNISWKFLMGLGLLDIDRKGVKIPYYTMEGKPYERYRLRTALKATDGTYWDSEGSKATAIPYGLQELEKARQVKQLVIPEGESDWWTLAIHKIPALAIPGAKNIGCLEGEHIAGIERIYVIQEPGDAGQKFPSEVKKRLDKIGYKGKIYAVDLKSEFGAKDPNDLHKKDPKTFKQNFETAMLRAKPLHKVVAKLTTHRIVDLQAEVLPDTRWAIDPILPEGVTILAGKPKLGKSWLALSIQTAISAGGVALGQYPVERGQVLYVALEDNKKRLQKRSNIVLQNAQASPDFEYTTVCNRIDEGGLEQLEGWIQEHPRARLICIDTWARFKPKAKGRQGAQYDEDYDAIAPLQTLASKYSVSILVVDHMRKMESEDPMDMLSGSVGKAGAVDGFLFLYRKRGETDARLLVMGRDIEMEYEKEYLLSFDEKCASWVVKGEADDTTIATTPQQQEILSMLVANESGLTVKALAERLRKNVNTTRNLLVKLRNENKVVLQNNVYCVVSVVSRSKDSNHSNRSKLPESDPEVTMPYYGVTTVLTTPIVTPETPIAQPVEPSHNGHSQEVTTLTTLTTKETIRRYGETYDWPRILGDGYMIPQGKQGWDGFLRWQDDKHAQAYQDIMRWLGEKAMQA